MKKFIQWLLLPVFLFLGSSAARATHVAASDINYRCLGGNQYEVTLRLYQECGVGLASGSNNAPISVRGTGNCSTQSLTNFNLPLISIREIPTICPALDSRSNCQSGNYFGYEEFIYRGIVDLSTYAASGCGWVMSSWNCCRNNSITNISNPSASSLYVETELIAGNIGCNNSAQINSTPVFVVCNGSLQNISHTMTDPDGDYIVYQLATPLNDSVTTIGYGTGISANQPLTTTGPYVFDAVQAQSTFTPNGTQGTIVDILALEYRNGVLIGQSRRTLQVLVVNCGASNAPQLDLVERWDNGTWVAQGTNTTFNVCLGESLTFRVDFSDADLTDSIYLSNAYSSLMATYPTATVTPTYSGNNHLTLEVTIPHVQLNGFALGIVDSECPTPRIQTYGFHIMPDSTCARLTGIGFLDANNNCLQDTGEAAFMPYQLRLTKGSNILTIPSNGLGSYSTYVDTGLYTVEVVITFPYYQLCPTITTVAITPSSGTTVLDLPIQVTAYCPFLSVNIGAPVLIHCHSNYYSVNYCNTGTLEAPDAYVDIWLDSLFVVDSTTYPIDSQNGNFYRFNLDTLDVGKCGNFRIYGQLDTACNIALLGQTYCATAHIYPDTICGLWNGANLVVEGKCTGDSVSFRILNTGAQPMATPRSYIVIEDNVMLHTGPNISLGAGVATPWFSYFANGSTFRAEIAQDPGYPWNLKASATVSGCISSSVGGLPITGMTNLFSLNDGLPSMSIDCQPSVAAFDPNDKQGFPLGYGSDHYIEANTDLEYRIRFQNTGTFFATQVVIRDTIAPELDIFSAQPAVASHPYTWRILDNRILEFTFNNIMLPDSGRDMLGSQGFIDFRIKQKPNLPLMTQIENSAAIYFDNNPPVITNTTWHTINENFIILTDLPAVATNNEQVRITAYPNPFEHSTTLHVHGLAPEQSWQVNVYSLMGQLLQQMEAPAGNDRVTLSRDQLASGIYIYTITTKNELLHSGKLIAH